MYTFVFAVCTAFLSAGSMYVGLIAQDRRLAANFDPPERIGHRAIPAALALVKRRH